MCPQISSQKGTITGYKQDKANAEGEYFYFSWHIHFPGTSLRTFMLKAVGNSLEKIN